MYVARLDLQITMFAACSFNLLLMLVRARHPAGKGMTIGQPLSFHQPQD
jgi:hypothetical protein